MCSTPVNFRRRAKTASVSLLLAMMLLGQSAVLVHLVTERHGVSLTSGEAVDLGPVGSSAARFETTEPEQSRLVNPVAGHTSHEHECILLAGLRDVSRLHSFSCVGGELAISNSFGIAPSGDHLLRRIPLYRLAPKNSPPTA